MLFHRLTGERRHRCGVRGPRSPARRAERGPMPKHRASSATKPPPAVSRPQVSLAAAPASSLVGRPMRGRGVPAAPLGLQHRRPTNASHLLAAELMKQREDFGHVRIGCRHSRKCMEQIRNMPREQTINRAVFGRCCFGLQRLSRGQMRALRARLGELDARLAVLSEIAARGAARWRSLRRVFVAAPGRDRNGVAATALQDRRARLFGDDGNRDLG